MDAFLQDFRFALRSLRKNPKVPILVALSLALAVAGNTVVFSFVNGFLFRPFPFPEPERIVFVSEVQEGTAPMGVIPASAANFLDWRSLESSFELLAGLQSRSIVLTEDIPEPLNAAAVTEDLFPLLGATPIQGRLFSPEELAAAGGAKVAVASFRMWRDRFGMDPDLAGRILSLDGEPHTIVGVLAEEVEFLDPSVQVWVPLVLDPSKLNRQVRNLVVAGRLAPGVSSQQAQAEMTEIASWLEEDYPEANGDFAVLLRSLRDQMADARSRVLLALLQGALIFVLLIACANIVNLLLARGQERRREMALRTSLGAGRRRLASQLLTESLLLSSAGGALGVLAASAGVRVLASVMGPTLPHYLAPVLDGRVLGFSLLLTAGTGLLFGLAPVLQSRGINLATTLKDGGSGASGGRRRRFLSQSLVVLQIALAVVLLGGGAVLVNGFLGLQQADPGFATDSLLTADLSFPTTRYGTLEEVHTGLEELLERLETLPGVTAVTASSFAPRQPVLPTDPLALPGASADDPAARPEWMAVSPGFHEALGIDLIQGRTLDLRDRDGAAPAVVVNDALARRLWPGAATVGHRITFRGEDREIVGVVSDVRHGLFSGSAQPTVYLPLAQEPSRGVTLTVRTAVEPLSVADALRREVFAFDGQMAAASLQTLQAYEEQFFIGIRISTVLLGLFGGLALLLAALGTYGVLAYSVARRIHEIGVRMALGARRGQVMRMVTLQGLALAAVGIALGLPASFLVSQVIASSMADLMAVRPVLLLAVAAGLAIVAAAASLAPAGRAASVNPVEALRAE